LSVGPSLPAIGTNASALSSAGPANPRKRNVYLAGYEVFFELEEVTRVAAEKKAICAASGLVGLFPGNLKLREEDCSSDAARAKAIYLLDVGLMENCGSILANLTPFRGVSADAGTCWELGHFVGQGKLAVAYTNDSRSYEERFFALFGTEAPASGATGASRVARDGAGCLVDMQTRSDNCMLTEGAHMVVAEDVFSSDAAMLQDLRTFEKAVAVLKRALDA